LIKPDKKMQQRQRQDGRSHHGPGNGNPAHLMCVRKHGKLCVPFNAGRYAQRTLSGFRSLSRQFSI